MIVYTQRLFKNLMAMDNPERKERLDSIIDSIKSSDLKIDFKEAPLVDLETVSLVHPKNI